MTVFAKWQDIRNSIVPRVMSVGNKASGSILDSRETVQQLRRRFVYTDSPDKIVKVIENGPLKYFEDAFHGTYGKSKVEFDVSMFDTYPSVNSGPAMFVGPHGRGYMSLNLYPWHRIRENGPWVRLEDSGNRQVPGLIGKRVPVPTSVHLWLRNGGGEASIEIGGLDIDPTYRDMGIEEDLLGRVKEVGRDLDIPVIISRGFTSPVKAAELKIGNVKFDWNDESMPSHTSMFKERLDIMDETRITVPPVPRDKVLSAGDRVLAENFWKSVIDPNIDRANRPTPQDLLTLKGKDNPTLGPDLMLDFGWVGRMKTS